MDRRRRLGSWKEIAGYVGRSVKTCQRWEQESELPVHRLEGTPRSRVFADKDELDVWIRDKLHLAEASGDKAAPTWREEASGGFSSLAVLPLRNLSGDAEREYVADALTEVLITELGSIGALRVISHQSVRQFEEGHRPLPEIAKMLDVETIVEGTILDAGGRVRLTVNLVRASPEAHLWAQTYQCSKKNVEGVQRQIAQEVARQARIKLSPEQAARLSSRTLVDPRAYDAYLIGKASIRRSFVRGEIERALHYYEKALSIDPDFAAALAELAWCHGQLAHYGFVPPADGFAREKAAAERALAIDPGLAEAHAVLGFVAFASEWDWRRADRLMSRALELNPSSVRARRLQAYCFGCLGRVEEADRADAALIQLDPLTPEHHWNLGWSHFWFRRYDQAIAVFRKLLAMSPDDHYLRMALALATFFSGSHAEALVQADRARSGIPIGLDQQFDSLIAYVYARTNQKRRAQETLDRWMAMAKERCINPLTMAIVHAGLGNTDEVFRWLEAGYQQRHHMILWTRIAPFFDHLRTDPRYINLMRRLNLPSA